jgi:hypothetical protein
MKTIEDELTSPKECRMAEATAPVLTALNYLFSHEGGKTIAHCLDLDLVTSGKTLEEAEASLNALVRYQIKSCFLAGKWAQLNRRAPSDFWQMREHAKKLDQGELEIEVPPIILPISRKLNLPVVRSEKSAA